MQRIKQIVLKNFKFFYGEVPIEIDRLNVLIYGENGSGKSSVYWALYTFLQSVFKNRAQDVQKYFNPRHEHNLINRFADEDSIPTGEELSYIKLVFEDEHRSENTEFISGGTVGAKNAQIVKQAAAGSELINYRLLSRIHDFKNSEQIDLFPVIDKDILMFVLFRQNLVKHDGTAGSNNAQDWWDYLKPGMQPRSKMHEQPYKDFEYAVYQFNDELKFYLDSIIESVNEYLTKFKQEYTVSFDFQPCVYDPFEPGSTTKRIHKTFAPKIYLKAYGKHNKLTEEKKLIIRLHTFFNEAKLTAIALSIRFAMLDYKLGSANLNDDTPKLLVLDDLLLSLDMSNRDIMLDIILGQDFSKYQLIILTHDRNFFELIRHKIKRQNPDDWKYIEMYECEKDGIPQPYIKSSETYLEKALKYFHLKEYEAAGNFLRKEAEAFCKEFLPKRLHYTSEYNLHDLNGLIQQCVRFADESSLDKTLFNQLDGQRKFVLNPTSHDSYNVPKFNSEVGNCLETLKKLRNIEFDSFLNRGTILAFELQEDGTGDIYQFRIKLEDDFRLIKEPGKDSVLSQGMVNYKISKNGARADTQYGRESIKKMYETNYVKSDKTKSSDFWEAIKIESTGESIKNKRTF